MSWYDDAGVSIGHSNEPSAYGGRMLFLSMACGRVGTIGPAGGRPGTSSSPAITGSISGWCV
uniref:Uncharacterized protein n=1 Tax=Anopheles albimanus TaxID=7167 RepID=A0A182FJN8_ANOAL